LITIFDGPECTILATVLNAQAVGTDDVPGASASYLWWAFRPVFELPRGILK
jgi:hypothetical protein